MVLIVLMIIVKKKRMESRGLRDANIEKKSLFLCESPKSLGIEKGRHVMEVREHNGHHD